QKVTITDVRKILDFNARDHPTSIRDLAATSRITVGHHRGADFGERANLERFEAIEELFVLDFQQRQVAVVRDEADFGQIRAWILVTMNDHLLGPAHDVRISHNAFAADDKAGARGLADHIRTPGHVPNRLLAKGGYVDNGFLWFSGGCTHRQPPNQQQAQQSYEH